MKLRHRQTETDPECLTAYGEAEHNKRVEDEMNTLTNCTQSVIEAIGEVFTDEDRISLFTDDAFQLHNSLQTKVIPYLLSIAEQSAQMPTEDDYENDVTGGRCSPSWGAADYAGRNRAGFMGAIRRYGFMRWCRSIFHGAS